MFNDIHQAAEVGYEDPWPLWMSNLDGSIFHITSRQEMEGKSDQEIQEMFWEQNVVIYDQFQPMLGFDEHGLSTLGDLLKPVTIHGHPVPHFHMPPLTYLTPLDYSKENTFDSGSRHQKGTLMDILECHQKKARILNGLDFPMPPLLTSQQPLHPILWHLHTPSICPCAVAQLYIW